MSAAPPLLEIKELQLSFKYPQQTLPALDDFSLRLERGERVGLVGESGAGKSLAVFAILKLLKPPCVLSGGSVRFKGQELSSLPERELQKLRGGVITMIFQNPLSSLNPLLTIGQQLIETVRAHTKLSKRAAYELACEQLAAVQLPHVHEYMRAYPHEFSGGMRQRIVIACALITQPELIIADEPTTALDVTIQAEIMEMLITLSEKQGSALLLVSHDLALISQVTQRVYVLYAGRSIETNNTRELITHPRHPYTEGLLSCLPERHRAGTELQVIGGRMPALGEWSAGCRFHPRCAYATTACRETLPPTHSLHPQATVKCFHPLS